MRNSVQGPLLRSGHNSSFKALGETGYPVFKMAFQLREAIYRLDAGRDLARHLAIPQNDQGGDRTDWYSSFPGDVIPWNSASETERESARQQFKEFQMAVQSLSEHLLNAEQSGTGGDRRVFAQLLKSVTNFPDYDFLYLVNGILVITFWGFIHPQGELRNPMHWLSPASVPTTALATAIPQPPADAAVAPSIAPVATPVERRRWHWRWLLWLLLALLLLALLMGLLRGCVPSLSLPGLPAASPDKTAVVAEPASERPGVNISDVTPQFSGSQSATVSDLPALSGVKEATVEEAQRNLNTLPSPVPAEVSSSQAGKDMMPPTATTDENGVQPPVTPPTASAPGTDSQPLPAEHPMTAPPGISAQGEPLTLPAALPDGPAQFLNGQWRVNGGIQDKLTGRPLQLQYNFDKGNGTVSVRQSNGVTCRGVANGQVQQGALSITNPDEMTCSDGSNFIVPTIECKSPAAGHADCIGSNDGEKTFPIRMLQPNS
ncbi:putative virulence effector protein [Enterobacteriaceae bacterium ATCC 29904]|nr:putative virulence effector protein [Enterobacteriaceae bacterium ATCC 29904]